MACRKGQPPYVAACALVLVLLVGGVRGQPPASPVDPQAGLSLFRLPPGLRIELVACEPDVVDPVEIRFDEDGRLWVVEMHDYPHGPAEGEPPKSRIRVLEDRDGDGRYETARTFADGLLFANGLQPWRGGVIVTLAGRIVYLKDTDGDGRADHQQKWFEGFAELNPQLRVNHPRFGPDNHVYVANGLRGGKVLDLRGSVSEPISINGTDFRFDPRGASSEAVSGLGQYGVTFDDFGNRFVCSNRNPLIHAVLEQRYLRRNPALAVPAVVHDVAAAGEASRVFPLTRAWTTSTLHAGQFTAACGTLIYRGDGLPPEMYGNAFTCEPTGNLVHREVFEASGASFTGRPAREGVEFLASTDEWFRPVNLELGPDGALYVVDMYRAVVEHPQFMPEELRKRSDLLDGDDRGRIYRIVSAAAPRKSPRPQLASSSTAELGHLLEHESTWWRDTAARLLYERQDASASPLLESLVREGTHAAARVQALSSLEGLGWLEPVHVETALGDAHPRVRETAVRLAEPWLGSSPDLQAAVIRLADDADTRLRFQVALSLGEVPADSARYDQVLAALADIALAGSSDVWTRRAVATAVPHAADRLLIEVLKDTSAGEPSLAGRLQLYEELAELVGSQRQPSSCRLVLLALVGQARDIDTARMQRRTLGGLSRGLERRGASLDWLFEQSGLNPSGELRRGVDAVFTSAAALAADHAAETAHRREAVNLLRHAPFQLAKTALIELVRDERQPQLRRAAIDALAAHRDRQIAEVLLEDFPAQTPAVKRALLDAMLRDSGRVSALLDAIEEGRLAPSEVDTARSERLLKHRDAKIRDRAKKLLAQVSADRQLVFARYRSALEIKSDARRGKEVFRRLCSTCHRVDDVGTDVAPDIADSRIKTPLQLLTDILLPNQAIDGNYVSYSAVTFDGRAYSGIITSESATSITLKEAEGKTVTLLRSDVEELVSSGKSLMPEGLERDMSVQQMADLISFIKNWRYLDSGIPLPGIESGDGAAPK